MPGVEGTSFSCSGYYKICWTVKKIPLEQTIRCPSYTQRTRLLVHFATKTLTYGVCIQVRKTRASRQRPRCRPERSSPCSARLSPGPCANSQAAAWRKPFNHAVSSTEMPTCVAPLRNGPDLWPYYEVSHLSSITTVGGSPPCLSISFPHPPRKSDGNFFPKRFRKPSKTKTINRRPRGEFRTEVTFLHILKGNERGPDGCSHIFLSIMSSRLRSCQGSHPLAPLPSRLAVAYTTSPRPEEHRSSPRKTKLHSQSSPGGEATWTKLPRALADALRNIHSLGAEHFWFKSASVFWAFPAETSKPQVLFLRLQWRHH